MKIHVDRIPPDGKRFVCEEPMADYAIAYQDFVFNEPISIDIHVQVVTGTLVVLGAVGTKVRMTCSRCLKEFTQTIRDGAFEFDCPVTSANEIIDLTAPVRERTVPKAYSLELGRFGRGCPTTAAANGPAR